MSKNLFNPGKKALSTYGFFLGAFGFLEIILNFPEGIFTAFFFGAVGLTISVLSREHGVFSKTALAGLILSSAAIVFSLLLYISLFMFYCALKDPVIGQPLFKYYDEMLSMQGISIASVSQLLKI